jgi:uncharacterized membrane protein
MNRRKMVGAVVAMAAAAIFAASSIRADDAPKPAEKKVKCAGINECKGKGQCGSADGATSCSGTNECAGKGWVAVTAKECKAKKGTVIEDKKKGAETEKKAS